MRRFAWPRWCLRYLPGNSHGYGPPRRWPTLDDYFAQHPGTLREVLPLQSFHHPQPYLIGNVPRRFLSQFTDFAPPGRVFTLADARLLGADGWIVGQRDSFLIEASFWGQADQNAKLKNHPLLRRHRPRPLRQLPGRTLSLASDFAVGGFGHFLHDSLTRLLLIHKAGLKLQEFDWVYLPRVQTQATDQLAAQLGVKPERLLNFDSFHDLHCEELTATSFPGRPGQIASVYTSFIREQFPFVARQCGRRIHLSRTGARRNYSNVVEVNRLLEKFGFEEVFPDRDPAVFQKCAEAEHVVAIEGANFLNATFCKPGTRVLIIFPDRGPDAPYALTLSDACGFTTFVTCGETRAPAEIDGGTADFYMDPAKLELALQVLIGSNQSAAHMNISLPQRE